MKFRQWAAFLGLIALWAFFSQTLNVYFLPSPLEVGKTLLSQKDLLPHLLISLYRVLGAILLAFIPALILGILSGLKPKIDQVISSFFYLLFPIPKAALLPIILLFLGLGNLSKIVFVSFIIYFQLYFNIRDEVQAISDPLKDSLRSLGGGKKALLFDVVLPAISLRIFTTLRMSLGTAIAVLFMAETFATRQGIGWYIMDAWSRLAYSEMYGAICALSFMGYLLFSLLEFLETLCCPWASS